MMPRPGPRPYECIRRAWHSDSHQPLRGALIQDIFKVVNELHSTTTRRKKEWQEKLPIVVLRAEEILYSKANSESEYANVETLRTRLDDAVNTMIRREETEEDGGPYLAPCIEAALSLGCLPKKVSRGQRQGIPRPLSSNARRPGSTSSFNPASCEPVAGKFSSGNTVNVDCMLSPAARAVQESCAGPLYQYSQPHASLRQDQAAFSASPPIFNSSDFPYAGCISDTNAMVAPSTCAFNPHLFVSSSYPPVGGMVQFLKTSHVGDQAGTSFPVIGAGPATCDIRPQMLSNISKGSAALQSAELAKSSRDAVEVRLGQADHSGVFMPVMGSSTSAVAQLSQLVRPDCQVQCPELARKGFNTLASSRTSHTATDPGRRSVVFPVEAEGKVTLASGLGRKFVSSSIVQQSGASNQDYRTQMDTLRASDAATQGADLDFHDLQLRLGPPVTVSRQSDVNCREQQHTTPFQEWSGCLTSTSICTNSGKTAWSSCSDSFSGKYLGHNAGNSNQTPAIAVDMHAAKRLRGGLAELDLLTW